MKPTILTRTANILMRKTQHKRFTILFHVLEESPVKFRGFSLDFFTYCISYEIRRIDAGASTTAFFDIFF